MYPFELEGTFKISQKMALNLENTLHFHQLETPKKNSDPVASKNLVLSYVFHVQHLWQNLFFVLGIPIKWEGLLKHRALLFCWQFLVVRGLGGLRHLEIARI